MLKVREEKLGDIVTLHFQGRIVSGSEVAVVRKAVLSQRNVSMVVLDLARVKGIDAAGLGVLLELREWAQIRGIEFQLRNVTKLVQQVLEITRLDTVFKISQSDDEVRTVGRRIVRVKKGGARKRQRTNRETETSQKTDSLESNG